MTIHTYEYQRTAPDGTRAYVCPECGRSVVRDGTRVTVAMPGLMPWAHHRWPDDEPGDVADPEGLLTKWAEL